MLTTIVLGLDLAGSEKNVTGYCVILNDAIEDFGAVFSNEEILSLVNKWRPKLVAIDAPLNFPRRGNLRDCDLLMKQINLNPLPPTLPGMRMLVNRAMWLVKELKSRGIDYIEVFPAGALRFLGYKKKPKSIAERLRIAKELARVFTLNIKRYPARLLPDIFDAIICAITGYAYINGDYIEIKGEECRVIFPTLPMDQTKNQNFLILH
ncbi:MAG: DUF429 domain-containing protein [Candidatus Njordarchaeales archaeon]